MTLMFVFVALVGIYTASAAVLDARLHRIPNYLTVPTALAGLLFHSLITNWGIVSSLAGFGLGFALLFVPWLLGGSGMGDVKLLAALGAWLGPHYMIYAFVASIFVAAILALGVMIKVSCFEGVSVAKRRFLAKGRSSKPRSGKTSTPVRKPLRVLPFAVPVAVSTWITLAYLAVFKGELFIQ